MRPSWTVVHWGTFLQNPMLSGVYFYSGNTCFEYFKAKITCMRSFCSSWPCHTMKTSGAGQATEERAKWRLSLLGHTCHVEKKKKKKSRTEASWLHRSWVAASPLPGPPLLLIPQSLTQTEPLIPGLSFQAQKKQPRRATSLSAGSPGCPSRPRRSRGPVPPEVSHPTPSSAGGFIYFSPPGAPPGPCSPRRGGLVAGLGREAAPRGAPRGAALTPSRCAAAAGPVSVSVCVCLAVGLCAGPGPSPWPRRSRWRRGSGGPRGTSRRRGPSGPAAAGGSWRPACAASSSPATWTSASAWGRPTACSASTGTCSTGPSRCVRAAPAVTGFPLGLVVVRACLGGAAVQPFCP